MNRKPPKRAKPRLPKKNDWDRLFLLIGNYKDAAIADSWKGGLGDPDEMEVCELRLRIASIELTNHIHKMKAELT